MQGRRSPHGDESRHHSADSVGLHGHLRTGVHVPVFYRGTRVLSFSPTCRFCCWPRPFFAVMDNFALVVVLFFILCGNIMTAGSIVEKLIKVANALVSWLPGGLGMAGVLACGLFGAISGSTVATVVALGGLHDPGPAGKRLPREVHPGPDDHLSQSGGDHPPQHRDDSLHHDQQRILGRALSDRICPRRADHVR